MTSIQAQTRENISSCKVGDYKVYMLSEGQGKGNTDILLNATSEQIEKNIPDGTFPIATNTFLIQAPDGSCILIDTGYGKELFNHMDSLNIRPKDIHTIMLTHMHGDHIGGLLKNNQAAFPETPLFLSEKERDYWVGKNSPKIEQIMEQYSEKLQLVKEVELNDVDLTSSVLIQPIAAYGHTPGHIMYLIRSKEDKLLIWGDLAHAMAIQMPCPEVSVTYDTDPDQAGQSRLAVLKWVSEHRIPVAGMHIAYPGIGQVVAISEGSYNFIPIKQ